jgi:uridine monophosphate synthetase
MISPPTHQMHQIATRLSNSLFDHDCIQLGSFTLKSGISSPIYIDLRLLVSHPPLLREVAEAMALVAHDLVFDRIGAIPYAGLPIGVALALVTGQPLVYPRREVKAHGTRRAVEGSFKSGETVLLIDDLITRGHSKLEAIELLERTGLFVQDVLVLIDREQGGAQDLAQSGYRLHAVLQLGFVLETLEESGRIKPGQRTVILNHLHPST